VFGLEKAKHNGALNGGEQFGGVVGVGAGVGSGVAELPQWYIAIPFKALKDSPSLELLKSPPTNKVSDNKAIASIDESN